MTTKTAALAKRFTFDAAHCLPKLPAGHKCANLHGHTYEVELRFYGFTDERGFVIDYEQIAECWAPIFAELDHKYLNDIPGLETPSTELLAHWMWDRLGDLWPSLKLIHIKESSTTWCEVGRADWMRSKSSDEVKSTTAEPMPQSFGEKYFAKIRKEMGR